VNPVDGSDLPPWREGDAWLAGGTWLFSEPQPDLRRIVDLTTLNWEPLRLDDSGLEIGATCTIAQLAAFAADASFAVAPLFMQCCRSLLGSFKVWNIATVGGNICMALPAGPMIALTSALDGVGTIWIGGDSTSTRLCKIVDLVTGNHETRLAPGDLLRAIHIPVSMLAQTTAFRRVSLNPLGRTGALVIGTLDPASGAFALTITGSTRRPVRLTFAEIPDAASLGETIADAIPDALYFDDVHGDPRWRRHVTLHFAEDIRAELLAERRP
jgi:CO/xanthine dehydrogenase FAD-binding subunit